MLNSTHRHLLWKIVNEELFGYPAGTLVCVEYRAGGGFAGAPEELTLAPLSNVKVEEDLESAEFPQPGHDVEYHVGGRSFRHVHFKDRR